MYAGVHLALLPPPLTSWAVKQKGWHDAVKATHLQQGSGAAVARTGVTGGA